MSKIIAITGLKGSGKNSAADYLNLIIPNSKIYSFASKPKDIVADLFGLDRKMLEGNNEHREEREKLIIELGATPRELINGVSESIKACFGDDIWIDQVDKEIYKDNPRVAIINDLRFRRENNFVLALKGKTIKIEKTHNPPLYTVPSWYVDPTVIEKPNMVDQGEWEVKLIRPQWYIFNDQGLDRLHNELNHWLNIHEDWLNA